MSTQTLAPNGTAVCTFPGRTPTQDDGNCHLNVNGSVASPDTSTHVDANGLGQEFRVTLPELTSGEPFVSIRQAFAFAGASGTYVPGVRLDVLVNDVAIVNPIEVKTIAGSPASGQVSWAVDEFIVPVTGEEWNAASSREMRMIIIDAASKPPGDPYIPFDPDGGA